VCEIDPVQAQVVVRIFEMARDGKWFRKLAAALNGEDCPAPRAHG
jgi:Recombinase